MNNKEIILKMYYEDKLKQNDITTILEISQSYISQIMIDQSIQITLTKHYKFN